MRPLALPVSAGLLPPGVGAGAPTAPDTDLGVDESVWFEACRRLAGADAFPAFFATAALAALERRHGAAACLLLARMAAAWDGQAPIDAALETIARDLLVILYTGTNVNEGTRDAAQFFPWSLAWQTLGQGAAPGICGGAFGAWSGA